MHRLLPLALLAACGTDVPGPPASLALLEQRLAGTVAETVRVTVRVADGDGRAVPEVAINATARNGRVVAAAGRTDRDGIARLDWALGTVAGVQALDVSVEGGGPATVLYAEARPGAAVEAGFTARSVTATGGELVALPFRAVDRYGNDVPDPPFTSSLAIPQGRVESGHWRASVIGLVRFGLDVPGAADTLDVIVHPPAGLYRAQFRVADTTWVETGRFVPESANPAASCTPAEGTVSTRVYSAVDVVRVRAWAGGGDVTRSGLRSAALVHAVRPDPEDAGNRSASYRPLGLPIGDGCAEAVFAYPWRFAVFANFTDSLVITP